MTELGKKIRLSRIFNQKSGKTIIVPMDHHGTGIVPIKGIEDPAKLIEKLANGGADVILSHIGTLTHGYAKTGVGTGTASILHMSVTTGLSPNVNQKVIVNNLKTAIALGVDAVSAHVNLGDENENEMIRDLGMLANECMEYGMPLLAMMYIRGKNVSETDTKSVRLGARIASELGCDIVKVPYTGDSESLKEVVEGTQIPVVLAGGSKMSDIETLEMIDSAMKAGCAGLSMGRNIFEREKPEIFLKAIRAIVHEGKSLEEAKKLLEK